MRLTVGDACKFGPLFFFLGFGFHVIVGGGGVRLNPCDLGCINGVDSSLHFFFFFLSSIGSWWRLVDYCWWWRIVPMGGGGGLCL